MTFLAGGARSLDALAAMVERRAVHEDIQFVPVLPCRDQVRGLEAGERENP